MEDEPKNEQPVQTGTQNPTIECPKCKSVESSENTYCTNCGGPLRGSAVPSGPAPSVTPSADNLVNARSREQLKHARIAIMVVAVLMVIMAIFLWYNMDKEIKKVEANPMMVVNQEAVSQNRLAIGVTFFLAAVFFGLFFWAKTNPFGAALTAFIIYITNIIVTIGIDPKSILQGIYVKAAIIVVLANGIKSGLTYKKAKESQQQLHHETLDRETMDTQHPHSTNE